MSPFVDLLPGGLHNETDVDNFVVHASVPANTFAVYGRGDDKELTELVPGILNQLGPDSLASLRKLAEQYQQMQGAQAQEQKEDDDDIPDLVEKFDEQGMFAP